MMEKLLRRGEDLARAAQHRKATEIAQRLGATFGTRAVATNEAEVTVRSRGLMKRWLADPAVRFLSKELK